MTDKLEPEDLGTGAAAKAAKKTKGKQKKKKKMIDEMMGYTGRRARKESDRQNEK